jgi:hypothetical protein
MRLFLLTYDRSRKTPLRIQEFDPGQYEEANRRMLAEEQAHPTWEVVLLEGPSLEALKRTHSRYFEDLTSLLSPAG